MTRLRLLLGNPIPYPLCPLSIQNPRCSGTISVRAVRHLGSPLSWRPNPHFGVPVGVERRRTAAILGWLAGIFAAIWFLGFLTAAPLAIFLYLKVGAGEEWAISLSLAVLGWIFFGGAVDCALHVAFPEGLLSARLEDLAAGS